MLSSDAVLERAAELKARGVPFVLATVVRCESPTSAKPGAKGIVDAEGQITGWIGGGCAQPAVISVAKRALTDGQAAESELGYAPLPAPVQESAIASLHTITTGGSPIWP